MRDFALEIMTVTIETPKRGFLGVVSIYATETGSNSGYTWECYLTPTYRNDVCNLHYMEMAEEKRCYKGVIKHSELKNVRIDTLLARIFQDVNDVISNDLRPL